MKLYTWPVSRGAIIAWYLQELGVEAEEIVHVDIITGKQKEPEYTAIFPFGTIPALEDGGLKLFESGAILLYLTEKFPEKSGVKTPEQRAVAAQWTHFANATLMPAMHDANRDKALPNVMGPLDKILSERDYLEERKFTVCDVAVGSYLQCIKVFLPHIDLSPWPHVCAYLERLSQRPAFAATFGSDAFAKRGEEVTKAREAAAAEASAAKE